MTLFRTVLVSSGLVFAFFSGTAEAQQNARAAGKILGIGALLLELASLPAQPDFPGRRADWRNEC